MTDQLEDKGQPLQRAESTGQNGEGLTPANATVSGHAVADSPGSNSEPFGQAFIDDKGLRR